MLPVLRDGRLYEFVDGVPPESLAWLAERFQHLESQRSPDGKQAWLNWTVFHQDVAIGYVQATIASGEGTALIGYMFDSKWWGRGLASEAVEAMISELRSRWDVTVVRAEIDRRNQRSVRLVQRLGFREASELSSHDAVFEKPLGP